MTYYSGITLDPQGHLLGLPHMGKTRWYFIHIESRANFGAHIALTRAFGQPSGGLVSQHYQPDRYSNIFRITAPLWEETLTTDKSPSQKGWLFGALMFSSKLAWTSCWINNQSLDNLRRHEAHATLLYWSNTTAIQHCKVLSKCK